MGTPGIGDHDDVGSGQQRKCRDLSRSIGSDLENQEPIIRTRSKNRQGHADVVVVGLHRGGAAARSGPDGKVLDVTFADRLDQSPGGGLARTPRDPDDHGFETGSPGDGKLRECGSSVGDDQDRNGTGHRLIDGVTSILLHDQHGGTTLDRGSEPEMAVGSIPDDRDETPCAQVVTRVDHDTRGRDAT